MTITFFVKILEIKIELSEMGPFEQITYHFYQRYQLEFLLKFSLHEIQIFQIKNKSLKA